MRIYTCLFIYLCITALEQQLGLKKILRFFPFTSTLLIRFPCVFGFVALFDAKAWVKNAALLSDWALFTSLGLCLSNRFCTSCIAKPTLQLRSCWPSKNVEYLGQVKVYPESRTMGVVAFTLLLNAVAMCVAQSVTYVKRFCSVQNLSFFHFCWSVDGWYFSYVSVDMRATKLGL